MIRVLQILNRFNLGGPTFIAAYLTKFLENDFETKLVGGLSDESEENSYFMLNKLGIRPEIIPDMRRSLNPISDIQSYRQLKSIIKDFKPQIVHTHASKAGALGRLAAHHLGVPVIIHTYHGHVFDAYFNGLESAFYKKLERMLSGYSDQIIALSQSQRDDLVDKYKICDASKVSILPIGLDLDRFREDMQLKRAEFRTRYQLDDDEIAIGIVGRIVPVKNHQFFVQAVEKAQKLTDKKIRAFIVGDGDIRQDLQNSILNAGLSYVNGGVFKKALFTFTSWQKDVDKVMAGMDIVALTSLNEGTPVSLIEAQAADKPIVSTNVGGIENIVIPNKTALLSETGNLDAFVSNLLSLINNPELRQNMSIGGWEFVRSRFHYSRMIDDTKDLYNKLLINCNKALLKA